MIRQGAREKPLNPPVHQRDPFKLTNEPFTDRCQSGVSIDTSRFMCIAVLRWPFQETDDVRFTAKVFVKRGSYL